MSDNKRLYGIQGWLTLFLFWFGIIVSLVIWDFGISLYHNAGIESIGGTLYFICSTAVYIYAISLFYQLKPNAVILGKIALLVKFVNALMVFVYANNILQDFNVYHLQRDNILTLIWTSVWFLYLQYSKRIRNTYQVKEKKLSVTDKFFVAIAIILIMLELLAIISFYL